MTQVLEILKAVLALMPLLVQAITTIETTMPAGSGTAKLDMVKNFLQTSFAAVQGVSVTFDQVWPALSSAIGAVVSAYNAAGLFKTSKPASPTAPAAS